MSDAAPAIRLTRRQALFALAAALASPAALVRPAAAAPAPLDSLTLFGPPAGPSILLAQLARTEALAEFTRELGFKVWRSPDEMRAGLSSGTMGAVVLPVQVAANLYNRGMKLRLLNVMTDGLLYIISADASIHGFPDLRGRSLAVPFRNDMPDLVLQRLLAHHQMQPGKDLTVQSTGSPVEAMQMLMLGRVDAALIAEPAGTAAAIQGRLMGKDIVRVIDIQAEWGRATGAAPILPQAGLAITEALLQAQPGLAPALQAALERAARDCSADPDAAAARAAPFLDFPAPVLAASIPVSRLVATPARAARASIEAMLEALAQEDPAIIGGQLPDTDFYL